MAVNVRRLQSRARANVLASSARKLGWKDVKVKEQPNGEFYVRGKQSKSGPLMRLSHDMLLEILGT
jgi:hypothetical protein